MAVLVLSKAVSSLFNSAVISATEVSIQATAKSAVALAYNLIHLINIKCIGTSYACFPLNGVCTNLGEAWRIAEGADMSEKLLGFLSALGAAFSNPMPLSLIHI